MRTCSSHSGTTTSYWHSVADRVNGEDKRNGLSFLSDSSVDHKLNDEPNLKNVYRTISAPLNFYMKVQLCYEEWNQNFSERNKIFPTVCIFSK